MTDPASSARTRVDEHGSSSGRRQSAVRTERQPAPVRTLRLPEGPALDEHLDTPYVKWVKPALDRVLAAVLIVLLSPVLIAAAIAVRLQLGRPLLHPQLRAGRDGEPFRVFKFRTMRPCRRRQDVPFSGPDRRRTHKHPDDPRITSVGRCLRSTSIDELPQLFNVLKGEMSLVGPRPEILSIVRDYEPWQHDRHVVKPGVTGLWQVSQRGNGLMHEFIALDIRYVREISLRTDLRLLFATVPALLRRGSAW